MMLRLLSRRLSQAMLTRLVSRRHSGAMVPFFGLLLLALVGFASLVTDVGLLYVERRHLQNTVDAAALAGAREFLLDGWTEAEVISATEQWAAYNGVPADQLTEITVGTRSLPIGDLPTVTVAAERPVNLLFAFAFGVKQMPVGAHAVAGVSPLRPAKIWPWAVSESNYDLLLQGQLAGGEVILKEGAQGGQQGNRLALALGGRGASVYENNIKYGFDGPIPVRVPPGVWTVDTEPGNMAGPTEDGVQFLLNQQAANPCTIPGNDLRCPLIGLVPVITDASWNAANGRKPVDVFQFAIFEIKRLDQEGGKGGKGHQMVVGEFLDSASAIGPTDPDSLISLFGIRLWD